jgi:hypothetical protein
LPGMSGEIAGLNEASKVSGPVSKHVYIWYTCIVHRSISIFVSRPLYI